MTRADYERWQRMIEIRDTPARLEKEAQALLDKGHKEKDLVIVMDSDDPASAHVRANSGSFPEPPLTDTGEGG